MKCLNCGDELQWGELITVHRDRECIEQDLISSESGSKSMDQPAARYECPACESEYETKFFVMKNQPGGADDPADVPELCEKHGILGLGWGGSPITTADSPPSNAIEAAAVFDDYFDGKIRMDNRDFVIWMEKGDFVFTHDPHQNPTAYFQVRVTGEVQTPHDSEAMLHGEPLDEQTREEFFQQDINQYREAEWKQISKDRLPGPIHRDFPIKNGTIRKIKSNLTKNVARNTVRFWEGTLEAGLSIDELHEAIDDASPNEVVNCLNEMELEEVVSSLVQDRENAVMQLNTAIASQPDTEAILRTSRNGNPHTVYFQVKSNSDPTTLGNLGAAIDETLYVYAGGREGKLPHAEYLSDKQIYDYLHTHLSKLPPTIQDTLSRQL
jgi:hypothetical protein